MHWFCCFGIFSYVWRVSHLINPAQMKITSDSLPCRDWHLTLLVSWRVMVLLTPSRSRAKQVCWRFRRDRSRREPLRLLGTPPAIGQCPLSVNQQIPVKCTEIHWIIGKSPSKIKRDVREILERGGDFIADERTPPCSTDFPSDYLCGVLRPGKKFSKFPREFCTTRTVNW